MKILLVTGQLAQETVRNYAKLSSQSTEVVAFEIAVAAFLTPKRIAEDLKEVDLSSVELIMVPGLVRGDTAFISEATGVQAVKGPIYAADLPTVLDMISEVQLSTTIPACDLLREKLAEKALQEIQNVETRREELLKKPGSMLIGNVAVGAEFPMRVLAEIVDAAHMDKETVQATAKRFVVAGADFIDVGMVAGESQPRKAGQIVRWVKQVVDVPVSIDTLDAAEIKAAIEAGAELVLSGDEGNIEDIAPYARNVAVVVIPTNQRRGYFPKSIHDRVRFMEETIAKAQRLGVTRCLADLIVEPNNVLDSFLAFKEFHGRNPGVPLFVGISNVTELFDADSVGLNATLALLSSEVGGSILLATEKSAKAKGTVKEEATAAKMVFLAKKRGSVPKDLGIDLLILKDKRLHEEPYDKSVQAAAEMLVTVDQVEPSILDSAGSFKISLDRESGLIVAAHYPDSDLRKPTYIIKGRSANGIYKEIVKLGLVSTLDHAAYLGSELTKAEVALQTGKQYIQDNGLFKKQ